MIAPEVNQTKRPRGRPPLPVADVLVTPAEAARRLGVEQSTISRWIDRGTLAAELVNGQLVRIRASVVDAMRRPYIPGSLAVEQFSRSIVSTSSSTPARMGSAGGNVSTMAAGLGAPAGAAPDLDQPQAGGGVPPVQ